MYPHRIRLRGPWEYEVLYGSSPSVPAGGKIGMPCRWESSILRGFAGRVRLSRRFGYPGRIDEYERVWLTFAGVEGDPEVWLNGTPLSRPERTPGPFEFEVTRLLQQRNLLVVEVEAVDDRGGLWGEVALEVRCTAFLRGLRLWATLAQETAVLHVAGEVAGHWEQPLELYVLLDNATVAYILLPASAVGRPFELVSEELSARRRQRQGSGAEQSGDVRVELVQAATVWYAVELPFAFPPPSG
jgi:hypothetical protein